MAKDFADMTEKEFSAMLATISDLGELEGIANRRKILNAPQRQKHKHYLGLVIDLDNLQSVCWTCHSGDIQSTEALGYDTTIGADGWPVDPKHPSIA